MKILWLCGSVPVKVAEQFAVRHGKPESWITGIHEELYMNSNFEIVYLFSERIAGKKIDWIDGNTHYISYLERKTFYDDDLQLFFEKIINYERPNCIHIFGTEGFRTLALLKAASATNLLDCTVIHIQGLLSYYSRHYALGLPTSIIYGFTFRDLIRLSNVSLNKSRYAKIGKSEMLALKLARHVMGRTEWDYACCMQINPTLNYHECNEVLRKSFYSNQWDYDICEKYSIFVSQSSYPIKGFHFLLEALPEIIKKYPKTHVYTTGDSPLQLMKKNPLRISMYQKYLAKLLSDNNLDRYVTFLGYLNEKEMCSRYLNSHVFVLPSTIENSSNSLGEAMLLGMPIVSSDVGGVKSLITHEKEGLLYQADASYMLSYSICKIFNDEEFGKKLSKNARMRATKLYDKKVIMEKLINVYNTISTIKDGGTL